MDVYQKKRGTYVAFQFSIKAKNDDRLWPEWFREAFEDGIIWSIFDGEKFFVQTYMGAKKINPNNYVVRAFHGALDVLTEDIFNGEFEITGGEYE